MKWTIVMQSRVIRLRGLGAMLGVIFDKLGVSLLEIGGLSSLLVVYALEHSEDGTSFFVWSSLSYRKV